MSNDISIILTIYKTPITKVNNLKNYKDFKLFIFEQEGSKISKKKISDKLNFKFQYFSDKKNIGLAKSSNLLLKKVKTKYCLFTQPDIRINRKNIIKLSKFLKENKKAILVTPNLSKKKLKKNKEIEFVKKIDAACILFDVKKIKEIGLFDEDYFLYWEDIDLMKRINISNFKMILANNIFAEHEGGRSTINQDKITYLRSKNFTYGEFVYDLKNNKLRSIKVIRKSIQNLFLFFFNIMKFQLKGSLKNLANLNGILKFIFYYLK